MPSPACKRACFVLVLVAVTGWPTSTACATKPARSKESLATAIEQRLTRAGDLTFPMQPSAGYFEGDPIQPQQGFQVYASLNGMKPFTFSVVIYKTAAQAATMYANDVNNVHAMGGDFHAFKIIRSGRVLYMAATAPAPDPAAPPVPMNDFLRLIAVTKANL